MATRLVLPFADVGSGIKPSDGAQLFFSDTGLPFSSNPRDTHTDGGAGTPNSNPVIADSNGLFPEIYITGSYRAVLKDKNNVQIWSADDVNEFATLSDAAFAKNFATLALAVADVNLVDGDALNIAERTAGNGGGAMWDVVLTSSVTPNTFNIVISTGNALLSFVLRHKVGFINALEWGCLGDGSTDDLPCITNAEAFLVANGGGELWFPSTKDSYDLGGGIIETTGNSLTFNGPNSRAAKITTTNQRVIANSGTSVRSYINIRNIYLVTTANSARCVDYTYWNKFDISHNILEISGSNSSAMYGIGTTAGASPFYGGGRNNDIAVLGSATGAIGYHFDAFISGAGDTIRGPNSINFYGGRVVNCINSIQIDAGNNNTFSVASEAVKSGGYDIVLGRATATHTGTATSGASSTITDTGANFATNIVNGGVIITGGTGSGQTRKISGASTTVITIKNPWSTIPDNTSVYQAFGVDALNNTFINMRSEGSTSKAGFIRRRAGSYQNEVLGGNISSLGAGVLISEDQFDFSDLNNFGGIKEPQSYIFHQDNVAASQTNVQISAGGAGVDIILPTDGEIVGITIFSSQAVSAGTLTVVPTINGAAKSLSAVLQATGGRTQDNIQVAPFGSNSIGGRNRRLGVEITTDGSFTPTSTDITVAVYVTPRN